MSSFVQCDQLIEQYEPLLVQLLLQALDPEFVCMVRFPVLIGLCRGVWGFFCFFFEGLL